MKEFRELHNDDQYSMVCDFYFKSKHIDIEKYRTDVYYHMLVEKDRNQLFQDIIEFEKYKLLLLNKEER